MSVIFEQAVVEKMSATANHAESTGQSYPLGAAIFPDGVNFSVFSRGASAVELLLFDREDDARPTRVIPIDPAANRTYHYWHVFVSGVSFAKNPSNLSDSIWTEFGVVLPFLG